MPQLSGNLNLSAGSGVGNACDCRRWRKKGAGVGAAVEGCPRHKRKATFGHRKRGCEATSNPSFVMLN